MDNNIVNIVQCMPDFIGGNGRSEIEIENAEKILSVIFAKDFRTYLLEIGIACFDGHELTGICTSPRLNVVDVTLNERTNNSSVPNDWYVIEQANIDGIVIWQNSEGTIFQTGHTTNPKKIADSLLEYITSFCVIN